MCVRTEKTDRNRYGWYRIRYVGLVISYAFDSYSVIGKTKFDITKRFQITETCNATICILFVSLMLLFIVVKCLYTYFTLKEYVHALLFFFPNEFNDDVYFNDNIIVRLQRNLEETYVAKCNKNDEVMLNKFRFLNTLRILILII